MLKKVAVALLAATMFSAPVLAQGTSGAAKPTPPVTSQSTKAPAAAQPAKPAVKAEVKKPRKHVRSHRRGGVHAKAVNGKGGKYLKAATGKSVKVKTPVKSMRHAKRGTHIRT
jgi:hypothetical protein